MFKHVVKYTFLALIWKKYRLMIVATLLLFAYWWLVGRVHADYLAYADLKSSQEYIGVSFLIKWCLLLVGLVAYISSIFWSGFRPKEISAKDSKTKAKLGKASFQDPFSSTSKKQNNTRQDQTENDKHDPFAEIRTKQTLRKKSDLVINKYPENKETSD